jgi:hypothetical protein
VVVNAAALTVADPRLSSVGNARFASGFDAFRARILPAACSVQDVPMAAEEHDAPRRGQPLSRQQQEIAGSEVSINGRILVPTEVQDCARLEVEVL